MLIVLVLNTVLKIGTIEFSYLVLLYVCIIMYEVVMRDTVFYGIEFPYEYRSRTIFLIDNYIFFLSFGNSSPFHFFCQRFISLSFTSFNPF